MIFVDPNLSIIERAILLATQAHAGQPDDVGYPYILHPLRVGSQLHVLGYPPDVIAAGYCHDVIEDCPDVDPTVIQLILTPEAMRIVLAVTRDKNTTYEEKGDWLATQDLHVRIVKLVDLMDNIWRGRVNPRKNQAKYDERYSTLFRKLGGPVLFPHFQTPV